MVIAVVGLGVALVVSFYIVLTSYVLGRSRNRGPLRRTAMWSAATQRRRRNFGAATTQRQRIHVSAHRRKLISYGDWLQMTSGSQTSPVTARIDPQSVAERRGESRVLERSVS